VLPGQILALLAGPSRSVLGFFDGTNWFSYTLPGVEERVAGLVAIGGTTTVLVTEERLFAIAPTGAGTGFRALSAAEGQTRSFRAEVVPAASAPAAPAIDASDVLRGMQALSSDAPEATAGRAPSLVARPLDVGLPPGAYRGFQSGDAAFAAIANRGIVSLASTASTALRSMSLVSEEDLQVVTDLQTGVWVRGRDGDVAKWVDGRLRRLALPDEVVPQAIASGPQGAYLVALVRGTTTVRVYVAQGAGFRSLVERNLAVPGLVSIPFAGVGNDGRLWLGLRVTREDGAGSRMRGAAVIDPSNEAIAYHHRQAEQGQGLPLADEVSGVAFDGDGNAWFATLSGAVRVEEHQAITFDESRGVRGDVVMDIVAGAGNMWVASAEGLGSYADRRFDYSMPTIVREHRPVALAIDGRGTLWAAGRYGLLENEGGQWAHFGGTSSDANGRIVPGLPTAELRDVETDGEGRVWLLGADTVIVLQ
jgi:ligand-binding sensor domain-containing protein